MLKGMYKISNSGYYHTGVFKMCQYIGEVFDWTDLLF